MDKPFKLPNLPFAVKDVKGVMSEESIKYHYEKHHAGYVDKANELIDEDLAILPTNEIIIQAKGSLKEQVSQLWNHTFLWNSLTRPSENPMKGSETLTSLIEESFKTLNHCKEQLIERGVKHFGSGWLFLGRKSYESRRLEWHELHDGNSPLDQTWIPLLSVDLWEHAYYIDFRNDRAAFLEACFDHLNWEFAESNLKELFPRNFDDDIRAEGSIPLSRSHSQRWRPDAPRVAQFK